MIRLTSETQIQVAVEAVDFRKQIDSLVRLCQQNLLSNPRSGTLFVFINRSNTMIRILSYDGTGYWLCTKRLSRGKYQGWPTESTAITPMAAKQLATLIKTMA